MEAAIGIDLGTTFTRVGIFQRGKFEIIPNDQGKRCTPSCVAFTDAGRFIGERALSQMESNFENTIFEIKRLMGRHFPDSQTQEDIERWPFSVVNCKGKPKVAVTFESKTKCFDPEEISAMILSKMKKTAEEFLGKKVTSAVITVPAFFNDSQRQATKDAGHIAGLNVLQIVNEPTAAALACGLVKKNDKVRNVLVCDIGGGTFDVSVVTIDKKRSRFEVRATAGDTNFGGTDFDDKLVHLCGQDFFLKNGCSLWSNMRAVQRLRMACEKAKQTLSIASEVTIKVDALHNGIDHSFKITRLEFEVLCGIQFCAILDPVEQILSDLKMDKDDIHEVLLVGGSTRIPRIRKLLLDFFKPCKFINLDNAVVCGAAIQAAILTGLEKISLIDITPMSIGVNIRGASITTIIKRNTRIPCQVSETFTTATENQNAIKIKIFELDNWLFKCNNRLGTLYLSDIPPACKGEPQIKVTFDVDENRILQVSTDTFENKKTVYIKKKCLSDAKIETKHQRAKMLEAKEQKRKEKMETWKFLENFAFSLKKTTDNDDIKKSCDETLDWLQNNHNVTKEEIENRMKKMQKIM